VEREDQEFIRDWCEGQKNSPQSQFAQKIGTRIVELIKRDPLSQLLTEALESNLASLKTIEFKFPELPGIAALPPIDIDGISLVHIYGDGDTGIPKNVKTIAADIEKKWYCEIKTTIHSPIDRETSLAFGYFPAHALWCVKFNILSPVEAPIMPIGDKWPLDADTFDLHSPNAFSDTDRLPIFINLSVIDNGDISLIRRIVGEIVKKRLKEFRNRTDKKPFPFRRGSTAVFHDKDLMFLYHMKERTFEQYLRWYDIHSTEKLTFRSMAVIDREHKQNPSNAAQLLEHFRHTRIKWGQPQKGEDNIEKGVKLLYQVIRREPYNQRTVTPIIQNYQCPDHGNGCTPSCNYYQNWLGRFNRLSKII